MLNKKLSKNGRFSNNSVLIFKTSSVVSGVLSYSGSTSNFCSLLFFFNFLISPTATVKSTSDKLSSCLESLFQALNFLGVNMVESFVAKIIKLPSSPNRSKKWSYSILTL